MTRPCPACGQPMLERVHAHRDGSRDVVHTCRRHIKWRTFRERRDASESAVAAMRARDPWAEAMRTCPNRVDPLLTADGGHRYLTLDECRKIMESKLSAPAVWLTEMQLGVTDEVRLTVTGDTDPKPAHELTWTASTRAESDPFARVEAGASRLTSIETEVHVAVEPKRREVKAGDLLSDGEQYLHVTDVVGCVFQYVADHLSWTATTKHAHKQGWTFADTGEMV